MFQYNPLEINIGGNVSEREIKFPRKPVHHTWTAMLAMYTDLIFTFWHRYSTSVDVVNVRDLNLLAPGVSSHFDGHNAMSNFVRVNHTTFLSLADSIVQETELRAETWMAPPSSKTFTSFKLEPLEMAELANFLFTNLQITTPFLPFRWAA